MTQPILFMVIGLPGAGKTTRAIEIEKQHNALRLTPDDWILSLYGHDLGREERDATRDPVEKQLWELACRALDLGCNVVIDYGFWAVEERADFRKEAEAHGARVYFVVMDTPIEEMWTRITQREESQKGTLHMTREDFDSAVASFQPITADEKQYLYS